MDLNRATLIGNLTRDPELKSLPSGKSVATFGIATNRVWTDQSGQKQKAAEFHNIVMWGKLAEIANQYLRKGRKAYIEGRLQTRDWTGQDGIKRYRTEIVADNMIMLDGGQRGEGQAPATSGGQIQSDPNPMPPQEVIEEEIKVEDIPF
jgi:single-strand DNA-binding protein